MIDFIVYGSDRENFSCDPSPQDQEAELIRGYNYIVALLLWLVLFLPFRDASCSKNRSLLFGYSFIRSEWMSKMNVHGSSSSPPNFTSKSMPIVYPKVIKLNVILNCVYSIIQAYKLVYSR